MADQTPDITLPLTAGQISRSIGAIVEQTFPRPRQELCIPVGDMERRLSAYAGELVQAAYNDTGQETERHRTEACIFAEDAGRRMRLIAQMHDALREAPRTPKVTAVLNAIDAEARRSPWLAEQITQPTPAEDARERLAKHLFLAAIGPVWRSEMDSGWDDPTEPIDRHTWRQQADVLLAVINGQGN